MKKSVKKIVIILASILALFFILIFFDVAKPTTTKEEVKYAAWYLQTYGVKDTKNSSALIHLLWRFSELTK